MELLIYLYDRLPVWSSLLLSASLMFLIVYGLNKLTYLMHQDSVCTTKRKCKQRFKNNKKNGYYGVALLVLYVLLPSNTAVILITTVHYLGKYLEIVLNSLINFIK